MSEIYSKNSGFNENFYGVQTQILITLIKDALEFFYILFHITLNLKHFGA